MSQKKTKKTYYIQENAIKRVPAWLLPILIISLLSISLLYFLPKIIHRYQDKNTVKVEEKVIQDAFLQEADAVIIKKIARIYDRPSLTASCITSALYNEPVRLLADETENGFYHIQLKEGISGYIDAENLLKDTSSFKAHGMIDRAMIINGEKAISSDTLNGNILAIAPMGSVFYVDYVTEQVIRVVLPGNEIGWMNRENLIVVPINQAIPQPESKRADIFCSSALKFLNIPYVPGGLGIDNIDLPGVIYLAGLTNGLEFSRDMRRQAELGTNISVEKTADGLANIGGLKAGDLLFFQDDEKEIESVAIYLADDNILYAYGNDSKIQIFSLADNEFLLKNLAVIRRIFE